MKLTQRRGLVTNLYCSLTFCNQGGFCDNHCSSCSEQLVYIVCSTAFTILGRDIIQSDWLGCCCILVLTEQSCCILVLTEQIRLC